MFMGTLLFMFFTSNVFAVSCLEGQEKYQNTQNKEDCRACVAGLYSDTVNAVKCERCDPGKVSKSTRAKSCEKCPPGKISYGVGKDEKCIDCLPGK